MSTALPDRAFAAVTVLLVGLAVLQWPPGNRGRARLSLAELLGAGAPGDRRTAAGLQDSPAPELNDAPPIELAPDLIMELVAAGLRGGLSVVDALSCAISAGQGTPTAPRRPDGRGRPLARARLRLAHRFVGRHPAPRRRRRSRPTGDPTTYLGVVVARLRAGVPADQAWLDPPGELDRLAGRWCSLSCRGRRPRAWSAGPPGTPGPPLRSGCSSAPHAWVSGWSSRWASPCCRVSCCWRWRRSCSVWRVQCSGRRASTCGLRPGGHSATQPGRSY